MFIFFSRVLNSGTVGVVMEWQEAALPMSCYVFRKTTTRSMPQSHAG